MELDRTNVEGATEASFFRVALVTPRRPGAFIWLSMDRYAAGLRAALESAHVRVDVLEAFHLPPRAVLRRLFTRYRDLPPLPDPWPTSVELLHFTDFYLAGHSKDFQGPRVATVHDLMPEYLSSWLPPRLIGWRLVYSRSVPYLPGCDAVITPSEHTRRTVIDLVGVPPERVITVPLVIPPQFTPEPVERARTPTLISIGTPNPNKNLEILLHALARPGLAHVRVVRVGALSPGQRELAARLGVDRRIEVREGVSEADLIHLIRSSWALVQPSMDEGFGIPIAEAMACGVPVVCSDGGALPEVAGDACRIVPLRQHRPGGTNLDDARDFAGAIQEVLDDAALQRSMAEAGLRQAERFRVAAVAPRLLSAYELARRHWRERGNP